MKRSTKLIISLVIVVVLVIVIYFVYNRVTLSSLSLQNNRVTLSSVSLQKMKYCTSSSDCVPVRCKCTCSGCGGFSYEDIVNKKYVDAWYYQQGCKPALECPEVCCMSRIIACENNSCIVKEIIKNE